MACEKSLGTGRTLIISYALEDCSATPLTTSLTPIAPAAWLPIGMVDNASETFSPRTTTANVEGELTTITSYTGFDESLTVSGLDAPDITAKRNQQALRSFQRTVANALDTPELWVRVEDTLINEYRYYYCTMGDTERSGEIEGNRTSSFNFTKVPTGVEGNNEFQSEGIPA